MGMKVNFSQDEAESTAREIPPTGQYNCKITEMDQRSVKPGSLNVGKPFWNVQFVIQDGPYSGSRLYGNIMLFQGKDGTLGALSQLLKSLGYEVSAGEFELPEPDDLIQRDVAVRGIKKLAGFDKKLQRDLPDRFQIVGYKSVGSKPPNTTSQFLP